MSPVIADPEITQVASSIAQILWAWLKRKGAKARDLAHIARVDEKTIRLWLNAADLPDSHQFTRLRKGIPMLNHIKLPPWEVIAAHRQRLNELAQAARAGERPEDALPAVDDVDPVDPVASRDLIQDQPVAQTPVAQAPVAQTPVMAPAARSKKTKKISFGAALKAACEANKMTAAELASTLEVHVATVHRWWNGTSIRPELYQRVIDLLPELKDIHAPIYDSATQRPAPPPPKTDTGNTPHQQLMQQFLDQEIVIDAAARTPIRDIYNRYLAWFDKTNVDTTLDPLHSNIFGREIHRLRPMITSERDAADGGRSCYIGLKLADRPMPATPTLTSSVLSTVPVPASAVPSSTIPAADTKIEPPKVETRPTSVKDKDATSPMQAAINATPWLLPTFREIANSTWSERFVVTNHALDRFAQRYLEVSREPTSIDRTQLGHLIKTCWNKGWFEKIVHNDEEFFVLALPGMATGQVFYALLREDQADSTGRFVAITVLTPEMKDKQTQASWDVKLNTPFKALLQEADVAQRLVPKKPDGGHVEVGGLIGVKPERSAAPTPPPGLVLMPTHPRWVQNARDAAPWVIPPLGSGYNWERYVHNVALDDMRRVSDPNFSGNVDPSSALDYTIDHAIRSGWFATFESKGESWRLVALPPKTKATPVVYALVRKNPLKQSIGHQRSRHHDEIVVAILAKTTPEALGDAVNRVFSMMPKAPPPAKPITVAPPAKPITAAPSAKPVTSPVIAPPMASPPAAPRPRVSLEEIALKFATAVSSHKDLAKQVTSLEATLAAQTAKVQHCAVAVTEAAEVLRSAQAALNDAETGQNRLKDALKAAQKAAEQAKAEADRLLVQIQGGGN